MNAAIPNRRSGHFLVPLVLAFTAMCVAACGSPDPDFTASTVDGTAPLEVQFVPEIEGDGASFAWDFGDGSGSQERTPTHVYEAAGVFTARMTVEQGGASAVSEVSIRVSPGAAGWVTISADSKDILAGETVQLSAKAFDHLGNPVENAVIAWDADEDAGSVNRSGLFSAAATSGSFDEAVTASFERQGIVGTGVLDLDIRPGEIARIELDPPDLDLIVGQRISLSATALDPVGTVIGDATMEFTASRASDSVTSGGELTVGPQASGGRAELVSVTATLGSQTFTQQFLGTVSPSVLDEVVVSPGVVELTVNERVTLTATGRDRFGNPVSLDDVDYSLADESVGAIDSGGVLTASNQATNLQDSSIQVKGWRNGVWRTTAVPLRVIPGAAASIEILPADDSVPMGAASPMVAIVRDEHGNQIRNAPVEWDSGDGGTITEDGTFVAGFEAGEFAHTVIATVPAGAAGNAEPVGATTDVTVRERSGDIIALDVSVGQDSDIALIDLRTSTIEVLIEELPGDGTANESGATWYPDGSRLVFASDATGTSQIYDYHIKSGEVRQLTDDPDGAITPAVSPDGARLAWVSMQNDRLWQVYVAEIPVSEEGEFVPVPRSDATKISQNDEVQSLLPLWSPDGSTIAYTTSRSITDNDVRTVPSDGTGEAKTISASGYVGLGWTEDGAKVRATVTSGEFTGLLVNIDLETGETVQAVQVPIQAFSASWSPDGSEIAIVDRFTGDLWLLDADGTGVRMTLSGTAGTARTAWRPVPIAGPSDEP